MSLLEYVLSPEYQSRLDGFWRVENAWDLNADNDPFRAWVRENDLNLR